ncbi:MAG: DUF72 domain-containing protein [Ktedonobacteraceae bacterium]|nr:DUF72 domain-containing protein [Ktedonobacteraceae bacterium]MBO0791132.1 DUF72 domain-containing protein [Ktedonobacteraceae bacterium]
MLYIGCPLWSYKEWVGDFFPARTRAADFLRLYSRQLSTVEGNTVFYALPSAAVIERWRQETPDDFRFCPKVLRDISHVARLDAGSPLVRLFVERMRGLGERLGPIFLQLPPSFAPERFEELRVFLQHWPADVRLAVEVRHPGFFEEPYESELQALLQQHRMARVLMDTRPIRVGSASEQQTLQARERKPDLPLRMVATTDFVFVRYIGHPRMEENLPFFEQWAQQLAHWYEQKLTLYVFCHCPFEVHSPSLCAELYHRVGELVPLPPLSTRQAPKIEQQRLF